MSEAPVRATASAERKRVWQGVALILLAALSWSTAGLFPRVISTDMYTTLFWRSLLGGASVLALQVLVFRPGQWQSASYWRSLFQLNAAEWQLAICNALAMICFIAAFYFTTVANVVFVYSAFPIVTLLLSAWLLHHPMARVDLVSAVVVVAGVALIMGGHSSLQSVVGTLLSFGATCVFALTTVGIKRYPQADMVKVTYVAGFVSALLMLPFSQPWGTSALNLAWLWLYGFLNIGVGFGAFLLGVHRLKPVLASILCMVEIPLAPLWAYLVFGESVTRQTLVGGAVILVAVLGNMLWPRRHGDSTVHTSGP